MLQDCVIAAGEDNSVEKIRRKLVRKVTFRKNNYFRLTKALKGIL
jgi:hypothetical protein